MCCIAACYLERLTDQIIDDMCFSNADGFGMAWIEGGKVRWQKGLDDIKAKLFARHLPLPYVAHARLATVGGGGTATAVGREYRGASGLFRFADAGTRRAVIVHRIDRGQATAVDW